MVLKGLIIGQGHEAFNKAYQGLRFHCGDTVFVEDDVYRLRNGTLVKVDPDTHRYRGPRLPIKEAIGDKNWRVQFEE